MTASALEVPRAGSAAHLFDAALALGGATALTLRTPTWSQRLPVALWCGRADAADRTALACLAGGLPPRARVLDLGCGPGRHTEQLARLGLRPLGVDLSTTAVALARRRGVDAVRADVLGPLPGGSWDGVLLLDGNVGIGGDPLLLLCRVRDLLAQGGNVLVELDGGGCSDRFSAVLDDASRTSAPFAWARLGEGRELAGALCAADLHVVDAWTERGRRFVLLRTGRRS